MDSRRSIVSTPSDVRPAYLRLLGGLSVTGLLLVIIFGNFFSRWSPDPRCADLLAISDQDVAIPLPPNCIETSEATPDVLVKYLDNERERRGLVFKKWIICKLSGAASKPALDFQQDQCWLPSYERLLTSLGAPSLYFLPGSRRWENLQSPLRCVRSPSRGMLRRSQGSATVNLPCGTEAIRYF
jgi:hypothetical protein